MRLASERAAVVFNSTKMGAKEGQAGTLESVLEYTQAMGAKAAAIACDLSDPKARKVKSRDGKTVLGDAFLLGDPDVIAWDLRSPLPIG